MSDQEPSQLARTSGDTALSIGAVVASAIPWIGGPVSNVLGGMATGRRFDRVREVLEGVVDDLRDFQSDASEQYVKTEDFEDLLEETLKRVYNERTEEKRAVYRAFLLGSIKSPGQPYDEQIRILRVLEQLQPDHLRVLEALGSPPDADVGDLSGSPVQTLSGRLPSLSRDHLQDLVAQLNDLRVTNLSSLNTMMTARGASDLRHFITPLGRSLLQFIISDAIHASDA